MSRPVEPFSASHPRCIFPHFGEAFDQALEISGLSITEVAKAAGVSREVVRGYRRGFVRPSPATAAKLEALFGLEFDLGEHRIKPAVAHGVEHHVRALNNLGFSVRLDPIGVSA